MGMVETKSSRIYWLDLAKGLAMLAIIYGHTFDDLSGRYHDELYRWIYAWHVPIFAVVTGVIYGNRPGSLAINKILIRVKTLIIPYFTFSFIYLTGNILLRKNSAWLSDALLDTFTFRGCAALWFLPVFFLAQVIISALYTVNKIVINLFRGYKDIKSYLYSEEKIRDSLIVFVMVGIAISLAYLISLEYYAGIPDSTLSLLAKRSVVLAFWLYIGFIGHKIFQALPDNIFLLGSFGAISLYLAHINGLRELWNVNTGSTIIYTLAMCTGTCCVFCIAKVIDIFFGVQHYFCKAILFIGKESLLVMGTHQLGLEIAARTMPIAVMPRPLAAVIQIMMMIIVVGAIWFLSRVCPVAFGKTR